MRIESAELKFTVLIEKNENEGYTVTVPSLPGCVTAIAGHIEALKTLGKQIPIEIPVEVPVEVGATS